MISRRKGGLGVVLFNNQANQGFLFNQGLCSYHRGEEVFSQRIGGLGSGAV